MNFHSNSRCNEIKTCNEKTLKLCKFDHLLHICKQEEQNCVKVDLKNMVMVMLITHLVNRKNIIV